MKRRILSGICTLVIIAGMMIAPVTRVNAEEKNIVDGSQLLNDDYSIGYATNMTRGVYLQTGDSSISKAGNGLVYANGTTSANVTVSTISVNVILERLSGGSWSRVTSWTATQNNTYYISSTKTVAVGSGYYYRVRSIHYANSDTSSSYTNGLYI